MKHSVEYPCMKGVGKIVEISLHLPFTRYYDYCCSDLVESKCPFCFIFTPLYRLHKDCGLSESRHAGISENMKLVTVTPEMAHLSCRLMRIDL